MYYETTFRDYETAKRIETYLTRKGIPADVTVLTSTTPQYRIAIGDVNIEKLNKTELEIIRFYFPGFGED